MRLRSSKPLPNNHLPSVEDAANGLQHQSDTPTAQSEILHLQRAIGNRATYQLVQRAKGKGGRAFFRSSVSL